MTQPRFDENEIQKIRKRILVALSDMPSIDQAVRDRKSIEKKIENRRTKHLNISECINDIFDKNGKVNTTVAGCTANLDKKYTVDMNRIDGYLKKIYNSDNNERAQEFLQGLSDRDKVILEAVLMYIESYMTTDLTKKIYDSGNTGDLANDSPNNPNKVAVAYVAEAVRSLGFDPIKSAFTTNKVIYPEIKKIKSIASHVEFLKKRNLWEFHHAESSASYGFYTRIFNSMPRPAYLESLYKEMAATFKGKCDNNEDCEKIKNHVLSIMLKHAFSDLFDMNGDIKEELFTLLPKINHKDSKSNPVLQNCLVSAYLTMVVESFLEMQLRDHELREVLTGSFKIKVDGIDLDLIGFFNNAATKLAMAFIMNEGEKWKYEYSHGKKTNAFRQILSTVKIKDIPRTVNMIFDEQDQKLDEFNRELFYYKIRNAHSVKKWQTKLVNGGANETCAQELEKSTSEESSKSVEMSVVDQGGAQDSRKKEAAAEEEAKKVKAKKVEAEVMVNIAESIKREIVENARSGNWDMSKKWFGSFRGNKITIGDTEESINVPTHIAKIYEQCQEISKLESDPTRNNQAILKAYKEIERTGASMGHSFSRFFLDKGRQNLYQALTQSYDKSVKSNKMKS